MYVYTATATATATATGQIMNPHVLLLGMLLTYVSAVFIVAMYYQRAAHSSISSILEKPPCKYIVLGFMIGMGLLTLLYERERKCGATTALILILLLMIYGLLHFGTHTHIHYVFANVAFVSILLFMMFTADGTVLYGLVGLQLLLALYLILNKNAPDSSYAAYFFFIESLYVLNFAVFYLYLHYRTYVRTLNPKN